MKKKQVRPNVGEPFEKLLIDLRKLVNAELVNNWSLTVVNRRTIAEAWKRAFPDKVLPRDAADLLKPFYKDSDLE